MKKAILIIGLFLCGAVANLFAQEKNASQKSAETKQVLVSYGIVADNSGSFRALLETVIDAVKGVVEENKPDDETFLVRFANSEKIAVKQDFTENKAEIQDAADDFFIEGGMKAFLDAVDFSARHLVEKAKTDANRRRVLVLISDGEDRQSEVKLDAVLKFLKEQKVRIYAIGITDERVSMKILDRLAKETGGKVFKPRNPSEVKTAITELAAAIRAE